MCAVPAKCSKRRPRLTIRGAKLAPFPAFITPCDPKLRERAPGSLEWLHEIKIEGYRAQLHIQGGRVRVYSRRRYDWTEQFRQIAQAAARRSSNARRWSAAAASAHSTLRHQHWRACLRRPRQHPARDFRHHRRSLLVSLPWRDLHYHEAVNHLSKARKQDQADAR
jgi:hypothetical protein